MARPGENMKSRLAGYVKRVTSFEDLKVPLPAENTHVPTAGGRSKETRESKPQVPHEGIPRAFYDTDASFDKTTTTADSTIHDAPPGLDSGHVHQDVPVHAYPDGLVDVNGDDVESYSSDASDDFGEEQPDPPQGAEAPQTKPDGRRLGRISGDTYPDTTSGRPSTIHTDDQHVPSTAAFPQPHNPQLMGKHERGAGTRLAHVPRVKQEFLHGQDRRQGLPARQSTNAPLLPEQVLKDASSGFKYAPNEAQTSRAIAAPAPQPQHQFGKIVPASATHHGHTASRRDRRPVKETHRPEPHNNAPAALQENGRKLQPGIAHHYAAPEAQQVRSLSLSQLQRSQQHQNHGEQIPLAQLKGTAESESIPEVADQQDDTPQESFPDQQPGTLEESVLDHCPPQLYDMPFNQIKGAPFDLDPNAAEPVGLSTIQHDDPLSKKMDALLSMDVSAKQEYFASLGIEEWEEAGDWFLAAFGNLTGRFKTARQDKRKLAREFEEEVEQRYNSVSKKRKLIAGAMDEMKESGGKVLQGTPKKATQKVR